MTRLCRFENIFLLAGERERERESICGLLKLVLFRKRVRLYLVEPSLPEVLPLHQRDHSKLVSSENE